jgi:hypothetical protein
MRLRGIVLRAELLESAEAPDGVDLALLLQGVGPSQPRRVVVPFSLLLREPSLDPETIQGHGIEAEVALSAGGTWIVETISIAGRRVLRPE